MARILVGTKAEIIQSRDGRPLMGPERPPPVQLPAGTLVHVIGLRTGAYRVAEIEPLSGAYARRRLLVDDRHVGE
jgi:hypothetical protein